jgi:hypothetical protein
MLRQNATGHAARMLSKLAGDAPSGDGQAEFAGTAGSEASDGLLGDGVRMVKERRRI